MVPGGIAHDLQVEWATAWPCRIERAIHSAGTGKAMQLFAAALRPPLGANPFSAHVYLALFSMRIQSGSGRRQTTPAVRDFDTLRETPKGSFWRGVERSLRQPCGAYRHKLEFDETWCDTDRLTMTAPGLALDHWFQYHGLLRTTGAGVELLSSRIAQ